MSTTNYLWRKLAIANNEDSDNARRILACAEDWLSDHGMALPDCQPDAYCPIDSEQCAFLFEFRGNPAKVRSVAVTVIVDSDADGAPGEGWRDLTRATCVEITRTDRWISEADRAVAADGRA